MTFKDIFKKSFLEGYASIDLGTKEIVVALAIATLLGLYIFCVYRVMTQRTFYSRAFNISLVGVTIITASIILTMQSSVVISLGMVGALSIVRFRTAVKDPMDLVYLFWAISIGIICGAGIAEVAVLSSIILTIVILVLQNIPVAKAPMMLVVNGTGGAELLHKIHDEVKKDFPHYKDKSKTLTNGQLNLVIELRVKEESDLLARLDAIEGVTSVALIDHDGEVTY